MERTSAPGGHSCTRSQVLRTDARSVKMWFQFRPISCQRKRHGRGTSRLIGARGMCQPEHVIAGIPCGHRSMEAVFERELQDSISELPFASNQAKETN